MTKLGSALCPVCFHEEASFDRKIGQYNILVCNFCRLAYVFPRPTVEELMRFYGLIDVGAFFYDSDNKIKRCFFERCYREIGRHVPNGRLLDFGCGDCGFLNSPSGSKYSLYGSDFNEKVRDIKLRNKVNFLIGPIEEQEVGNNYFDAIFTSATYEHLLEPCKTTQELNRILKPGGLLMIVSVPNYNSLNIKFGLEDWKVNSPPAHINYFDINSINKLIEDNGFEVIDKRTYGLNVEPIKRALWFFKKYNDKKKHNKSIVCHHTKNDHLPYYSILLSYLYFSMNYKNIGDKLCVLAKKRS